MTAREGGGLFVKIDDSIFAVKLYEMEEQYGKLQCRIRACEQGGRGKIRSALKKAEDEYKENTMLLEEKVRSCRSPAVKSLTRAQLDYRKKTADLMDSELIRELHSEDSRPGEDQEEAELLYAEFAMDFATLSVQQALIAALTALDRQKSVEVEQRNKIDIKERVSRDAGSKET